LLARRQSRPGAIELPGRAAWLDPANPFIPSDPRRADSTARALPKQTGPSAGLRESCEPVRDLAVSGRMRGLDAAWTPPHHRRMASPTVKRLAPASRYSHATGLCRPVPQDGVLPADTSVVNCHHHRKKWRTTDSPDWLRCPRFHARECGNLRRGFC